MPSKKGCRYGLVIQRVILGKTKPLCFSDKGERDRVANYLTESVAVTKMTLKNTEGTRALNTFKGYTVDNRLREFRQIKYGKMPEFISFDSKKGRRLLKEMKNG